MNKHLKALVLSLTFVSTAVFASAIRDEETSLPKTGVTSGQFQIETYQRLFNKADEDFCKMSPNRQKAAKKFAKKCPVFADIPSFFKKTVDGSSYIPSFVGEKWTHTDGKGRLWYVIDRSGSKILHKTSGVLLEEDINGEAPDYAMGESQMVRSHAFKTPSLYGREYVIINNKDVGKPARIWFTLYPAW